LPYVIIRRTMSYNVRVSATDDARVIEPTRNKASVQLVQHTNSPTS